MAAAQARRWWNTKRFDFLEVALLGFTIAVFVAVAFLVIPANSDALQLAARYGPNKHSEGPEEWIIRDFFRDRRGGFFVDVGANHYRSTSKTFYLETALGWRGLAVEPQREFADGYARHRPNTKFLPFFVSDVSNEQAKLYVLSWNRTVTSGRKEFVERFGSNPAEVTVPTITLNDLLQAEGVHQIDFMNIDIELWEPKALAGFDVARYRPELVCIEALPEVRQFILDYFVRHGYVILGKYLRADTENLYFTPLASRQ